MEYASKYLKSSTNKKFNNKINQKSISFALKFTQLKNTITFINRPKITKQLNKHPIRSSRPIYHPPTLSFTLEHQQTTTNITYYNITHLYNYNNHLKTQHSKTIFRLKSSITTTVFV